ncbi:hypothetical protein BV25DRAFT_1910909 [Artomyces pyxidatus]|uniref:Uncharacterized protein n=2 Tax=Artomyces pyxidatus TaxID=48021 RepID=A0ACB8SEN9_9AGAM|nr:hypothetical protein BV25DRAFT_1843731 [Artomyces pyxidatus]KAI0069214.1 hypothetical protein BV25DRAFT_1910909 [Artomyces pyxidatus]
MADYVLEVFGNHLRLIKGSLYEIECQPVGALALSAVALQFAVGAWSTGAFLGTPEFSRITAEGHTLGYIKGTIAEIIKRRKFPLLLKKTEDFIREADAGRTPALLRSSSTGRASSSLYGGAIFIHDPSSPARPPADDE